MQLVSNENWKATSYNKLWRRFEDTVICQRFQLSLTGIHPPSGRDESLTICWSMLASSGRWENSKTSGVMHYGQFPVGNNHSLWRRGGKVSW